MLLHRMLPEKDPKLWAFSKDFGLETVPRQSA